MNSLRIWTTRLFISIIISLSVILSFNIIKIKEETGKQKSPQLLAWWGTLYPDFCLIENATVKNTNTQEIEMAFWFQEKFFLLRFW